ncbi:hypothetical protein BH11ARM2_BH11ARM2_31990 [soil metagenome]
MRGHAETLWRDARPEDVRFVAPSESLPEAARLYLRHAIAPGTPLARAVRLRMHGDIRLKGWLPLTAEQVVLAERGMVWEARTKMHGLPVSGFDEIVEGRGRGVWKAFGMIPVMSADGADVSRSVAGRMASESVLVPSLLLRDNVVWKESSGLQARFLMTLFGHTTEVALSLAATGRVETIQLQRWGNPTGQPFGLYSFGGYADEERAFAGFTIPSRLRMGWHFGTDGFENDGEFFRASIDDAEYR